VYCLVEPARNNLSLELKSWFYGLVSCASLIWRTVAVVSLAFAGWVAVSILQMQKDIATIQAQTPLNVILLAERFKRLEQKLDSMTVQQVRVQKLLEEHMAKHESY